MNRKHLKIAAIILAVCVTLSFVHVCLCQEESCPLCAAIRTFSWICVCAFIAYVSVASRYVCVLRSIFFSYLSLFRLKTLLRC